MRRFSVVLLVALSTCTKTKTKTETPSNPPPASEDGAAASESPPAEEAEAELEPGAPGVPWKDKTFDQRQEWMGVAFYPAMKKSFQAHDEVAFKSFKCQTCHGEDMKERNFAMPSDSIFPLDPKDPIKASLEYDEAITKFMMEQVVPEAAKLLDMEPYNPETGQGFGCFGCHPSI